VAQRLRTELQEGVVWDARTRQVALRGVPAPRAEPPLVLARMRIGGIDGTDEEVAQGQGVPPPGRSTMVLGHEALGEILEAPQDSGLAPGDPVVPLVRVGCGACDACAEHDAPDLCRTDDYAEHGIKGLDGFLQERWALPARALVPAPRALGELAVLTEPLSIAVKALDHAQRAQQRIPWFAAQGGFRGGRALLLGTGSLGTLGAFLLAEQGLRVWAVDRSPGTSAAARLLARLGVRHVNARDVPIAQLAGDVGGFDLVLEATGAPQVMFDAMRALDKNGVLVLLGVPGSEPVLQVEAGELMKDLVLGNRCVLGSVNSNRRHFRAALDALQRFQARWPDELRAVITHRYAPADTARALEERGPDVVKKVVAWA
jgi:threonine dehydrogenase-like Zn-dependent dehydrogenase